MDVERGLAGFALPFAAGIASAIYLCNYFPSGAIIFASLFFILCTATAMLMICALNLKEIIGFGNIPDRWGNNRYIHIFNYISNNYMNIPILFAGLTTGLMIGFSSVPLAISEATCNIQEFAIKTGDKLAASADLIPFKTTDTNALIKALLIGDKSGLSTQTKQIFQSSGASHILALSGLHLGIIYCIVSKLLTLLGNSQKARVVQTLTLILICGIYTMITGASASISRAFIFILLREIARLTFRSTSLKDILTASIIIQLTISPHSITSVGFQLSYAAMFGIAYIYPWLKNIWPTEGGTQEFRLLHKIWDIAALSTACQLTAGSIAWFYFGTFPKYFIITNLIAMPISGILIPLALLTLIIECLGFSSNLILAITEKTADLLTYSLSIISGL